MDMKHPTRQFASTWVLEQWNAIEHPVSPQRVERVPSALDCDPDRVRSVCFDRLMLSFGLMRKRKRPSESDGGYESFPQGLQGGIARVRAREPFGEMG